VPLSEHEQRLLEQMERALYAEDPKFASSLQNTAGRRGSRKRLILGALIVVIGIALLVTGVAAKMPIVGVVGFIGMLLGAVLSLTGGAAAAATEGATESNPKVDRSAPPKSESGGFMGRMEDRWKQRREDEQQ
jgi:hypothetical protein